MSGAGKVPTFLVTSRSSEPTNSEVQACSDVPVTQALNAFIVIFSAYDLAHHNRYVQPNTGHEEQYQPFQRTVYRAHSCDQPKNI